MKPETLLRLYPRAWRERYGEEFLDACGARLSFQQVIDIIGGAIDARFEPQSHLATQPQGAPVNAVISKLACGPKANYTTRDGLIGAAFIVGSTILLTMLAMFSRSNGWTFADHFFKAFAFPASMILSSHFTFLKGQSTRVKLVISGGTLALIGVICAWSAAIAAR